MKSHRFTRPAMRRTGAAATALLALLCTPSAQAYQNFPFIGSDGQTQYLKWGDNHAGTPAPVIRWSFMPAGTPGSAYCGEACTGVSVGTIPVFNPATNHFDQTPLVNLVPQITAALGQWAGAARIEFAGPDGDTGVAINAPDADPPNTGHIRIGAFFFTGNSQFTGAVGYAAPPNGGTGSGDVLFNANVFFQNAPGAEGDAYPLFPPGGGPFMNDVQGLFTHEVGHAIGMAHPNPDGPPDGPCAVMSINEACYEKINRVLDPDDVAGIQFLYGAHDGGPPSVLIDDPTVAEGNSGTHHLVYTVSLSAPAPGKLQVHFATANGTAAAGSDYTTKSGTLKFTAGQTSKTISVDVAGDTAVEPNETVLVNLSGAVGATIGDAQGTGTIVNDDGPQLRVANKTMPEGKSGSRAMAFAVTMSPSSTNTVTVNYATANGTATVGSDYAAAAGMLTFAPGETSKTVNVSVNGDTTPEPNETFFLNLTSPVNALLADGQGLGTITNDDGPLVKVADVSVPEGNTGTSTATFTVTLTPAGTGAVSVIYATANGTATAGSDYTAASGTLTFAAGETSKTVGVAILGDTVKEAGETFTLNLSGATGTASIYDAVAKGTIVNDD